MVFDNELKSLPSRNWFDNVNEVDINAANGHVEIEGWDSDHAEVDYTIHGEVTVEVGQKGGKLIIREEPKKKFLNFGRKSGWAEIRVKVPRNAVVNAKTVNGELNARNVWFGNVATVNCKIELEDCEAKAINTVNSRITAHLRAAGPLTVSAVNGKVELTIEELDGNVDINCVNGDITLRLTEFCDARIVIKRANAHVSLVGIDPDNPVIGAGQFEVRIKAVNGYARVELV